MAGVSWTDGRVVSGLIVAAIALVTAIASLGTSAAIQETALQPAHATGTAAWARALVDDLATYQGLPDERYDRDTYDRGWRDHDGDCQTGRHEVLIEESVGPVSFVGDDTCKVESGQWIDPYAGVSATLASEVSIDHVVSLADAHRSGGWRWSHDWREAFANDLDDPATLAVSATSVNSAKGSASPDGWLPEEADARCRYAIAWVRVKTRWQLAITAAERKTLEHELDVCSSAGLPLDVESAPLALIDFSSEPVDDTPPLDAEGRPCDARYESVCIPYFTYDLDCDDVEPRRFAVTLDPHSFDGDANGIGCEN